MRARNTRNNYKKSAYSLKNHLSKVFHIEIYLLNQSVNMHRIGIQYILCIADIFRMIDYYLPSLDNFVLISGLLGNA